MTMTGHTFFTQLLNLKLPVYNFLPCSIKDKDNIRNDNV